MKERPILFNSEMVRAVLENRKTQTRRVVKGVAPDTKWRFGRFEGRHYERRKFITFPTSGVVPPPELQKLGRTTPIPFTRNGYGGILGRGKKTHMGEHYGTALERGFIMLEGGDGWGEYYGEK